MKIQRRDFLISAGAVALGGCAVEQELPEDDTESTGQAITKPAGGKDWYKRFWKGGKSPTHRRQWNVGVMSYTPANMQAYADYMGAAPEFVGANCTGAGSGRWVADTWEKVIGGPFGQGDGYVERPSQASLTFHPQLRTWLGGPSEVWGGLYITTIPFGAPLSECRAAARGERDDLYKRLGARVANQLASAGRSIRDVILRPNWEGVNQDTGLQIHNPSGGKNQFYLAGGTTNLYNDMMEKFARAFWEGAGHRVPIAFSPAMDSFKGVPHVPYDAFLEPKIYDICCGSFHPTSHRTKTEALARQLVYGRPDMHTPAAVLRAARKHGAVAAFLEHSARHEPNHIRPHIDNIDVAYQAFGDILAANQDVLAFTAALGLRMVYEESLAGEAAHVAEGWRQMVRAHRGGFGKLA